MKGLDPFSTHEMVIIIPSLDPLWKVTLASGQVSTHFLFIKALSSLEWMKFGPGELLVHVKSTSPMEDFSKSCAMFEATQSNFYRAFYKIQHWRKCWHLSICRKKYQSKISLL